MRIINLTNLFLFLFILDSGFASAQPKPDKLSPQQRAQIILDSIYTHYAVDGTFLLRENYPFDAGYQASYLGDNKPAPKGNAYSYLWPFSGSLSAQVALLESQPKNKAKRKEIDTKVLTGLEEYIDQRAPVGYASYVRTARQSDRFYDDNVWLGIDFADLYLATKDKKYLAKSEEIWRFVASGMDDKLGGGIYWCEQKKESKNTCSNAPGVVFLMKLYQATKKKTYLDQAVSLYAWTKKNLQDPTDHLYFDHVTLSGKIGRAKFPYNSGQMLQAAVLLYEVGKEKRYLEDAQAIAKSAHGYFFHEEEERAGKRFRLLKNSDIWFIAVMMRGFVELYQVDRDPVYLQSFKDNLDYAWENLKDENGLFYKDWKGERKNNKKWLLDQAAMAEMNARLKF